MTVPSLPKKNRIAKEWSDAAESSVDFVRQGKDYFRDELNTPGMLRLIGNVKELEVLDVACGEGYNTRILACKGAKVTGIDLSREMVEYAKSQEKGIDSAYDTTFRIPPTSIAAYVSVTIENLLFSIIQ